MSTADRRPAHFILLSLFICSLGNSAIIPFIGYFIVEELGLKPWHISIYSAVYSVMIMVGNRLSGEWIDKGGRIYPLVVGASLGLAVGSGLLSLFQSYWLLLVVVGPSVAVASAGVSTMYSLGRLFAEQNGLDLPRYNARVRMMTSLGWMFGPAASYLIAAHLGNLAVFRFVFVLALIGLANSLLTLPRDFRGEVRTATADATAGKPRLFDNRPLWLAAFVCLMFSIAHTLCAAALPLFYIQEAHLPVYAPGLSLTLKCAGEVVAIFSSPFLMTKLGRRNSLYLSASCAMLAFIVLHQTDDLLKMCVGATLEGLYFGLFAGVAVTFMQGFARGRVGRATSLYMNSLFLGSLAANTGTGLIASFYDFRAAIVAAGGVMLLAAVALFMTRHADQAADA
jgi:SET family sugar efflux transporter-like MFS transporter